MVVFTNRGTVREVKEEAGYSFVIPNLKSETIDAAPGLEQEWRGWITEPPRDADAVFVGFCRK